MSGRPPTPDPAPDTVPDGISDADLMAQIAQQDKQAFVALFGRFASRVKAFMLRWGMSEPDADEIAQDVMVQVWRRAETFDPAKAGVSTWIFTIARNRRIDRLRRLGRPEVDPNDPLYQPDPEPDGATVLSAQERDDRTRSAIATLGPEQVQMVRASFYEGLSHGEIAEAYGLPLGTVKSRLRLAFKALKAELGDAMQEELFDD